MRKKANIGLNLFLAIAVALQAFCFMPVFAGEVQMDCHGEMPMAHHSMDADSKVPDKPPQVTSLDDCCADMHCCAVVPLNCIPVPYTAFSVLYAPVEYPLTLIALPTEIKPPKHLSA